MPVIINGSTGIDTVQDGIVTDAKLNLTANSQEIKDAINAGGSAPIYAARAWVNFNGTGTVAIRGSGNVSSITDNGTGDYTINFTNALPDANYNHNITLSFSESASGLNNRAYGSCTKATSTLRFRTGYVSSTLGDLGAEDEGSIQVAIFR